MRMSATMVLTVLLLAVGQSTAFGAGNDEAAKKILLSEMPSVEAVRKVYRNRGKMEDLARLGAAYNVLAAACDVVSFIPGNLENSEISKRRSTYNLARNELSQGLSVEDGRKLFRMTSKLQHSEKFQQEVHAALFSPQWLASLNETRRLQQARVDAMQGPSPSGGRITRDPVTQAGFLVILAVTIVLCAKSSSPKKTSAAQPSSDGRVRPQYGFSTAQPRPGEFEISFQRVRMGLSERLYWFISVGVLAGIAIIGLASLSGLFDNPKSNLGLIPMALTFWVPALWVRKFAAYRQRPGKILITAGELAVEKNMRGDLARYDRDHIRSIYLRYPDQNADRVMSPTVIVGGTGIAGGVAVASHAIGRSALALGDGMRQWGKAVSAKNAVSIRFDYAEKRLIMAAGGLSPERAEALFDEFERVLTRVR